MSSEKITISYTTDKNLQQSQYIRCPQNLLLEEFKTLSFGAKFLYMLMLNRTSLSLQNGWVDSKGRAYIYYTVDQAEKDLYCSHPTAVNFFKELVNFKLVETKRQGQGKPNLVYVKTIYVQKLKTLTSRSKDFELLEVKNFNSNKIDISKIDMNNIYPLYSLPLENSEDSKKEVEVIRTFDLFWSAYPKRISKAKAKTVFGKVVNRPEIFKAIMDDLQRRKKFKQWTTDNGQFIPHPTTYLNQRRWEDEYETISSDNSWEEVQQQLEEEFDE